MGAIPQGFSYAQGGEPMPYKPKRPCSYPGCGRLAVREQYCAEHQKVMDKQYERDPGPTNDTAEAGNETMTAS